MQRRMCVIPTWRGWSILLLALAVAGVIFLRGICAFLTVNDSVPGGALVVEGWVPGYAAQAAIDEFRRNHYQSLYVTGGPIEEGSPLLEFGTYAELTATMLRRMGADAQTLHAVPSGEVRKDRTYSMALALKEYLPTHGSTTSAINLVSLGTHSRRSRLIFRKAFGKQFRIGVIAIEDRSFDPARWWTTSAGFRTVTDEIMAYVYARFLFHPVEQKLVTPR